MFPFSLTFQNDDEKFMLEALKEAWKAFKNDEVPIGAVVVREGKIIARGQNQVELLHDATAHAEMISLTSASEHLENWRLLKCTLYSTLEPCTMCAGAMIQSRLDRLVYGAPDLRQGANGSWIDIFSMKHPIHNISITKGVFGEHSTQLMKDFFAKTRKRKNGYWEGNGIDSSRDDPTSK